MKRFAAFQTVEHFWRIYNHLLRPDEYKVTTDYHLFKDGIKPTWEDPQNAKGGKWMVRLKKGLASRFWEELVLAIVGEQFDVGHEICGAVCSVRNSEDIISIWNKNHDNVEATSKIRDQMRRILKLPAYIQLEYKKHQDSLVDKSSYRNPTIVFRPHDRGSSGYRGDRERGGDRGGDRGERGDRIDRGGERDNFRERGVGGYGMRRGGDDDEDFRKGSAWKQPVPPPSTGDPVRDREQLAAFQRENESRRLDRGDRGERGDRGDGDRARRPAPMGAGNREMDRSNSWGKKEEGGGGGWGRSTSGGSGSSWVRGGASNESSPRTDREGEKKTRDDVWGRARTNSNVDK